MSPTFLWLQATVLLVFFVASSIWEKRNQRFQYEFCHPEWADGFVTSIVVTIFIMGITDFVYYLLS